MPALRLATWNTKQGVAPRQKARVLWDWISRETDADILVLTEARLTADGIPDGWQAVYTPGGLGGRRNYGTIIAARNVKIQRAEYPRSQDESEYPNPATTFAVEVFVGDELELVVLGAYGLLDDHENGFNELGYIIAEYADVVDEYGVERVVIAGDFNLWPEHMLPIVEQLYLDDVTAQRKSFPKLREPRGGSRIWTHKNGAKDTDGARQELDFIFVSKHFDGKLKDIRGGVDDFPDAWDMSDHAPVAVTLEF
jgi:exonuclease III